MSGFSRLFSHSGVLLLRNHHSVRHSEIREAVPPTVGWWNALPQTPTGLLAPIAQRISDDLPCLAAQSNPHPDLVDFFEHERPQFIEFQHRGSGIFWIWGHQGRAE